MKLIEVQPVENGTRFSFDHHGFYSWLDVTHQGEFMDGTFKEDTAPYIEQRDAIDRYYPAINDE